MFAGAHVQHASAGLVLAAALCFAIPSPARSTADAFPEIAVAALPAEGREVLTLIHAGGPFRYDRDGVVFGNYEHLLPPERKGYYHEYTVHTPGSKNRGARRIICGGPAKAPVACYYTSDHYQSFQRIRE